MSGMYSGGGGAPVDWAPAIAAAQAAAIAAGFGAGQSAVDVAWERSLGVVYTNSTGKPLFVLAVFVNSVTSAGAWIKNGAQTFNYSYQSINAGAGSGVSCVALIPPGGTYVFNGIGVSINSVIEYR